MVNRPYGTLKSTELKAVALLKTKAHVNRPKAFVDCVEYFAI